MDNRTDETGWPLEVRVVPILILEPSLARCKLGPVPVSHHVDGAD